MKRKFYAIGLLALGLTMSAKLNAQDVELNRIGGYSTGVFDEGACEIVSYDKDGEKLYFVNADAGNVGVLDISDASNPTLEETIDVVGNIAGAGGVNAVAVGPDFFAVAVENDNKQENGWIAFFELDGTFISAVDAGALPDNVQVSPDGKYVVSANEGEPDDDYMIDPEGSITVVEIPADVTTVSNANATTVTLDGFNGQTFTDGTRIFGMINPQVMIFDGPRAVYDEIAPVPSTVAQDLEPEYVAFSTDSKEAYVVCQENNTIVTVDLVNKDATAITGLGFKDHSLDGNGYDASDKADDISIETRPTLGMYQPDAMVTYNIGGEDYIFTANEGDARDYDGFSEEVRVEDLTLDAAVFPEAATLQDENNLGRVKTTTANGDTDGDGQFEEIYSYGARSFSIWKASDISQVYDSGDDFEQQLLESDPDNFNSTNDENDTRKNRSDDKGCEPEAIDVGTINGKHYAFIGLERMGGVMVYDVTDVNNVEFVTFENNRNFEVAADSMDTDGNFVAGDLAPECVVFIPAADHGSSKDMLVVSNEVSGSISIFEVVDNTTTTGIESVNETALSVFPNPANGEVINTNKVDDYAILNAVGQQIAFYNNTNTISTANLSAGMYFIVSVNTSEVVKVSVVK